jgi:hypothetical protein
MAIRKKTITEQLEKIGFTVPFTFRFGPCENNCVTNSITNMQTYYNPVTKEWLCEKCFYKGEI